MSDSARPCPWLLSAGAIGDRISYTHSPLLTPPPNGLGKPLAVTADGYNDEQEQEGEEGTALVGGRRGRGHEKDEENHRRGNNNVNIDEGDVTSSFALVTALSEPLEASICAELVRPRGAKPPPFEIKAAVRSGQQSLLGQATSPTTAAAAAGGSRTQPSGVAAVILGPVVGRVDVVKQVGGVRESCRVAVVIEVDGDSAVTCVVSSRGGGGGDT